MKKVISLVLAIVMVMMLGACVSNNESKLIGTWTCSRDAGQDAVSKPHTYTLELYKGGTFYRYDVVLDGTKYNGSSGTWSEKNGILTLNYGGAVVGYVMDLTTPPYSLTKQSDSSIVLKRTK
ncbi:MAG: hypothetical protein IK104_05175 [Clostridia bacterium]|nr:hypothetical protein [Clostridia bacterium]